MRYTGALELELVQWKITRLPHNEHFRFYKIPDRLRPYAQIVENVRKTENTQPETWFVSKFPSMTCLKCSPATNVSAIYIHSNTPISLLFISAKIQVFRHIHIHGLTFYNRWKRMSPMMIHNLNLLTTPYITCHMVMVHSSFSIINL